MKVVILCGGQGTRLREHTERIPKPLVPIGERPIVWHIMRQFAHHGFDQFVLCLGYKGHKIREYFEHGEGSHEPWQVELVDTGEHAMTGARVKRVAPFIDGERFMLTYGDGVADIDVPALLATHRGHGQIGTVTGVHPPARFGELMIRNDQVVAFSEKPQVRDTWINGGFFVFERCFLDSLDDDDSCILERGPLERLAAAGGLHVYRHTSFWQCMDTWRDYRFLNERWSAGAAPWATWQTLEPASVG